MAPPRRALIVPAEEQSRELDAKLLLACVAAERGFSSVIGSRREMEFNIDAFPCSIYLSKSMTIRSLLFFRVAKQFGHEIISWDEEALVHLPPETYFSRRLDPRAIRYVSHLFAWGADNEKLWRQYPDLPDNTPIHITGNPRSDKGPGRPRWSVHCRGPPAGPAAVPAARRSRGYPPCADSAPSSPPSPPRDDCWRSC